VGLETTSICADLKTAWAKSSLKGKKKEKRKEKEGNDEEYGATPSLTQNDVQAWNLTLPSPCYTHSL
jgi:hypothetical protein